jgi:hypothetical protein
MRRVCSVAFIALRSPLSVSSNVLVVRGCRPIVMPGGAGASGGYGGADGGADGTGGASGGALGGSRGAVAFGLSHHVTVSPLSVISVAIPAVILVSPSSAHMVQIPYEGTNVWPAGQSSQLPAGHGATPSQPCSTPGAQ